MIGLIKKNQKINYKIQIKENARNPSNGKKFVKLA